MNLLLFYLLLIILLEGIIANLMKLLGRNETYPPVLSLLFEVAGALVFLPFVHRFPELSTIWIYPLAAGIFYGAGNIFMFKAYEKGDVSLLSPLFALSPVLSLLLAIFFLKEPLTILKAGGVGLIFLGLGRLKKKTSLLSSLHAILDDANCRNYFYFVLCLTIARMLDKKATAFFLPATYTFLQFVLPAILMLVYIAIQNKLALIPRIAQRKIWTALYTGIIVGIKYLFFYRAITFAEISRVIPLNSLSTLVAVVIAAIFFKEKVQHRWIGALFMVAGAILLAYRI